MTVEGSLSRWWRLPVWLLALGTGAKSFVDNPILGSRRLNRAGLHVLRIRAAHAVAGWRRARIAPLVSKDLREQFDRDGFIIVRDVLPPEDFLRLYAAVMDLQVERREQQQGDTITGRIPIGPRVLRAVPGLESLLNSSIATASSSFGTYCRPKTSGVCTPT